MIYTYGRDIKKQILASDLFIQTNSFSLIKWKCWMRRPWIRCVMLFAAFIVVAMVASRWLLSLSLSSLLQFTHRSLYYCLYFNYTVAPYTHINTPTSLAAIVCFYFPFVSFGRTRLRFIKYHGMTSESNAWSHGSTFSSLNFALLSFALLCSNQKWQMWLERMSEIHRYLCRAHICVFAVCTLYSAPSFIHNYF